MRQWLIEMRNAAKMSQQAVADAAGISQSCYAGIETSARGKPLAVPVAKAIANVLGFDWTMFYEDDAQNENRGGEEMLTAKENSILDKAEDAILRKLDECLASSEPLTDACFETLLDGVRTLDRICRIKYSQIPIQKGLSGHPAPDHPADPMHNNL